MSDLSVKALERFVAAVLPKVIALTGLPREDAEIAAVSLLPPVEEDDAGNILLRDEEGRLVGSVPADEIDPYEVLEAIEE